MNADQQPKEQEEPAAPAGRNVQSGGTRGIAREEGLEETVRQHPKRDEPRVDSVEPGEMPPAR
ncbi:MAG: hypothetical protein KGL68_13320 [Burkholderiales bacterium]|nr:hypothetical protein [Burkholderiales bacterium]